MNNSKDNNLLGSLDSPNSQSLDVIHVEPDGDAVEPLLEQEERQDAQGAAAADSTETHNVPFGMLCYAISSFFFAMMAVVVKLAGRQGLPTWEIIFCRSTVVMALTLPQVIAAGKNPFGNRRLLLCFRGFTGFVSNSSLFFAVQLIPIADMAVFTFLTPIFVALVSPFVLSERLAPGSLLTCGLCMLGVILVAQPPILFGEGRLTMAAVAIGLLHPVMSACAKASIRILTRTEINQVMVFYLSLFTMVGSLLGMLLIPGQMVPIKTVYQAVLLIAAGCCGYGTQMFMNMGLRRVKAAQAMTMSYLGIVWSGVAGVLVFREFPNLYSGIGDAVIVASTLLFALRSAGVFKKKQRGDYLSVESSLGSAALPETPGRTAESNTLARSLEEVKIPISRGAS